MARQAASWCCSWKLLRRYVEYDFTASLEDSSTRFQQRISWQRFVARLLGDFSAPSTRSGPPGPRCSMHSNEMRGRHISCAARNGGDPRHCPTCPASPATNLSRQSAPSSLHHYPDAATPVRAARSEASGRRILGNDPATDLTSREGRVVPYIHSATLKDYARAESRIAPASENSRRRHRTRSGAELSDLCRRKSGKHPETGEPITRRPCVRSFRAP